MAESMEFGVAIAAWIMLWVSCMIVWIEYVLFDFLAPDDQVYKVHGQGHIVRKMRRK